MKKEFTVEAEQFWAKISNDFQEKILNNVFCAKCLRAVRIKNYTGQIKSGDLLLEGECSKCGHQVARLIESE